MPPQGQPDRLMEMAVDESCAPLAKSRQLHESRVSEVLDQLRYGLRKLPLTLFAGQIEGFYRDRRISILR